ncbi:hypothetical protein F0562_024476 [Nyssa sinensis]|uniref:Uncharacterized protein n=1 Tax=Nyssa sinensis TaxID=561372 RepID=A0A5J5BBN4_9ASTE|nr:hypothetical protein F0562_024476 [Nyssa sinensis]
MNNSGTLEKTDLWYDWPNGRNFNIIQNQLGKLLYDLEWDNGTSYMYTLDSTQECRVLDFPVGILRPGWLAGANYLGQRYMDGFLCNVWEKVDFIWYYEDVVTKRPVYWVFYTGYTAHVMTFEVGKVLEDAQWQAPVYCFKEAKEENITSVVESVASAGLLGYGPWAFTSDGEMDSSFKAGRKVRAQLGSPAWSLVSLFRLNSTVTDIFDGEKQEGLESEKSLITRSLLLDFSQKSEGSDSVQVFLCGDTQKRSRQVLERMTMKKKNGIEEIEKEDDEDYDDYEGEEQGEDGLLDELCVKG